MTGNVESSEVLSQLLGTILDGYILADVEGNLIDVNSSYCRMIGYSREELVAMNIRQVECDHDEDQIRERIAEIQRNGGARFQTKHRHKNGHEVYLDVSITLLSTKKSAPRIAAFVQDVSQRMRAEELLQLQSKAMDSAADGIVICDATSSGSPVVYANEGIMRLTGYTRDELLGRSLRVLQGPESDPIAAEEMRNAIKNGVASITEILNYRKTGETFWNQVKISPIRNSDGELTHFIGIQTDITERKRFEKALRKSEAMLRSMAQSSPDYIFLADTKGRIEFINRTVPDQTVNEVLGKPFYEFVPDECQATILECLDRVRRTLGPDRFEVEYQSRTGKRSLFEANIGPVVRDGSLVGFSIASRDVTEQRQIQSRLQQTERLASLGTLAAGIAHEINNPLAAAWTAADAAMAVKGKSEANEILDECLETVADTVQRAQKIIDNVLRFARQEPSEKVPCNVNEIVQLAISTASLLAKSKGVTFRANLNIDLPNVMANAQAIEQVLVNLLTNAIQAGSKTVTVDTMNADNEIGITVTDDGHGVSDGELERIFDPFFTTGQATSGTGLGLAISYGIIEDHGGKIEAESKLDSGSTFIIKLPVA